jgi:hypothetical protein
MGLPALGVYPKQGFLPLLAFLERQLSLPLRLRFPMYSFLGYALVFIIIRRDRL